METTPIAPPAPHAARGLPAWMRQHPLLAYSIMAYAFTWIMAIPFILGEWHVLPGDWTLTFVLKPFVGPALAAILMTGLLEGKAGVSRLLRRVIQWREGVAWYAFILLAIPAFFLLGVLLMPGALASFQGVTPRFLIAYPINFIVIFFFGGPLGEEIGWRGFALPRLQSRYGALKASLLLGVLWTFWHLPDFLTSAQHGGPQAGLRPFYANLPIFLVMVTAIAILFTWIYNHTHGSLFMAILAHASINTLSVVIPLFPIPVVTDSELPMAIGWGALALLLLALSRGKLGYSPEA